MNLNQIPAKVTPLWIVAAFVTLTEAVLGYALTKVTGNVQTALTVFVIAFALLVAGAFFVILWNRPYVFYPPSEYGSIDPKAFVSALRPQVPQKVYEQVRLAASVEKNPSDTGAQFSLIDSMLDEVHRQHLILMHDRGCDLPYGDFWSQPIYEMEYGQGSAASGGFDSRTFVKKLEGTGFLTLLTTGPSISLTGSGHRFAQWLVDHGRKATFLRTEFGGWGDPQPQGPIFDMRKRRDEAERLRKASIKPGAPPNGGPATQLGTAGVAEGPPSVS